MMTSVADLLGFGPKREVLTDNNGHVVIRITAPTFVNPEGKSIDVWLTEKEYQEGYIAWRNGALIQDAMPFLSKDDRDKLMTGLESS